MKWFLMVALAVGLVGFVATARADEKKADDKKAADPTGTWKWSIEINGQTRDLSVKLALDKDGKTLTGAMPGPQDTETKIADGKFNKETGEVSFSVTRERNGNKVTTTYKGTVKDDTIKFTSEREVNGEKQKREFEAKRAKDEKKDK
jgi:hypothetical protein